MIPLHLKPIDWLVIGLVIVAGCICLVVFNGCETQAETEKWNRTFGIHQEVHATPTPQPSPAR